MAARRRAGEDRPPVTPPDESDAQHRRVRHAGHQPAHRPRGEVRARFMDRQIHRRRRPQVRRRDAHAVDDLPQSRQSPTLSRHQQRPHLPRSRFQRHQCPPLSARRRLGGHRHRHRQSRSRRSLRPQLEAIDISATNPKPQPYEPCYSHL